jgi:hypothetical protein
MSDQPPLLADAVEAFVARLRQRSISVNTIKSSPHDFALGLCHCREERALLQ